MNHSTVALFCRFEPFSQWNLQELQLGLTLVSGLKKKFLQLGTPTKKTRFSPAICGLKLKLLGPNSKPLKKNISKPPTVQLSHKWKKTPKTNKPHNTTLTQVSRSSHYLRMLTFIYFLSIKKFAGKPTWSPTMHHCKQPPSFLFCCHKSPLWQMSGLSATKKKKLLVRTKTESYNNSVKLSVVQR